MLRKTFQLDYNENEAVGEQVADEAQSLHPNGFVIDKYKISFYSF